MTDRYRASKGIAHGTGRAQCWSKPRRPEQEPAAQSQPKAGVEALKSIAIFIAGGLAGLAVIFALVYAAMLLSYYSVSLEEVVLVFTFISGGLVAVHLWLTQPEDIHARSG